MSVYDSDREPGFSGYTRVRYRKGFGVFVRLVEQLEHEQALQADDGHACKSDLHVAHTNIRGSSHHLGGLFE